MSSEITEENAQGVLVPQIHNENSNLVQSSMNDTMASSNKNLEAEFGQISSELGRNERSNSFNRCQTQNFIRMRPVLFGELGKRYVDESVVFHVDELYMSADGTIKERSKLPVKNKYSAKRAISAKQAFTDSSESEGDPIMWAEPVSVGKGRKGENVDKEGPDSLKLKGLRLNDFAYSEGDTESESDTCDSENGERIQMKKRKEQKSDSWLSELGIDKVSTELPELSALELDNKEQFLHMGDLECVIDKIVTITGLPGMPAYDLDTLLFLEEGQKVLGYILDVIGPVTAPVYVVPMSSAEAIRDLQLIKGTKIYCAPKSKYTKVRKSGPNGTGDAGIQSESRDFSEDEERQQAKGSKKERRRRTSSERYRRFVKHMNRANEKDTRLHKMADKQRQRLETMADVEHINRQIRANRIKMHGSSVCILDSEGRRSRPLFRHNAHAVGVADVNTWNIPSNNASSAIRNHFTVMPPFDPSTPPPNCQPSSFSVPATMTYLELQRFYAQAFARQNNMPGPSSESWFN